MSGFPIKTLYSLLVCHIHATYPTHLILDFTTQVVQIMQFPPVLCLLRLLKSKCLPQHPILKTLKTLSLCSAHNVCDHIPHAYKKQAKL